MYAYISGTVASVQTDSVIIDNQGIGYRIYVPASCSEALRTGENALIYTYFSVREDAMQLFGFLTEDDLAVFRLLIAVSGIGPKGALGILSVMNADDLRFAVLSEDAAGIAKAPGIGKKTAQKVILELKDKLDLKEAFEKKSEHSGMEKSTETVPENEAVLALCALGYSNSEALRAVKQVIETSGEADTEQLIKAALKILF